MKKKYIHSDYYEIDLVVNKIVDMGGSAAFLGDTDAITANLKMNTYYFVKFYTSLIPYIYGLLFLSQFLIKKILNENHIKIRQNKNDAYTHRAFITSSGHMTLLKKIPKFINIENGTNFIEDNASINIALLEVSKKILKSFPGLGYLSFDVNLNKKTLETSNFNLQIGPHIYYKTVKGKNSKNTLDLLVELITGTKVV